MIGARVQDRMNALSLSQAELARRVGMSQQAVHKLVRGTSRSTANLHRFARELGTTAAYLAGETDDPAEGAQAAPDLAFEEREALEAIRAVHHSTRDALLTVTKALSASHPPLPSENALADMFEGLLLSIDLEQPVDEVARELAQLLPTGLAQLQGRLIELPRPPRQRDPVSVPQATVEARATVGTGQRR